MSHQIMRTNFRFTTNQPVLICNNVSVIRPHIESTGSVEASTVILEDEVVFQTVELWHCHCSIEISFSGDKPWLSLHQCANFHSVFYSISVFYSLQLTGVVNPVLDS